MATQYQLLSRNESDSNYSESSIIIPMDTFGMSRRSASRQERRAPIPWYLDGCKLTKVWQINFQPFLYCFITKYLFYHLHILINRLGCYFYRYIVLDNISYLASITLKFLTIHITSMCRCICNYRNLL